MSWYITYFRRPVDSALVTSRLYTPLGAARAHETAAVGEVRARRRTGIGATGPRAAEAATVCPASRAFWRSAAARE